MKLIVCLDERGGMAFGGRRQSRDRLLMQDLLKTVGADRLWIEPYSVSLFEDTGKECSVSDRFLEEAGKGDWCYVERQSCQPYLSKVEGVTIYLWNRHYPSDLTFDIDLVGEGFSLREREEFAGSSHEKITKEVFER